ncbi:MAG: hypothetical protein J0H20_02615, partial [Rhizobiales bacterium]|nr:hypothetical protein [Hyphomicrobiales bacterium]
MHVMEARRAAPGLYPIQARAQPVPSTLEFGSDPEFQLVCTTGAEWQKSIIMSCWASRAIA